MGTACDAYAGDLVQEDCCNNGEIFAIASLPRAQTSHSLVGYLTKELTSIVRSLDFKKLVQTEPNEKYGFWLKPKKELRIS
ncbi:Protein of unknown function [Gryllus bimaculatus]|nr:Protein of unknown function [Gryllus bimaculatus]